MIQELQNDKLRTIQFAQIEVAAVQDSAASKPT